MVIGRLSSAVSVGPWQSQPLTAASLGQDQLHPTLLGLELVSMLG